VILTVSSADQIVYLDRLGLPYAESGATILEPVFNPKILNASVGETITFQARFKDETSVPVIYNYRDLTF